MSSWTRMLSHFSQLKVKSVTDPLFKYGLLSICLGVISAFITDKNWVAITLFSFGGFFFLIGIIFYCYFALTCPDYLRSETYQLKKQAVEILGDNEKAENKNLENIPSITNPYYQGKSDDHENPMLK